MRRLVVVSVIVLASVWLHGTADAQSARAELKDATGKSFGTARLEQKGDALQITATLTGLPPGPHAFHIHAVGKCEGPEFTTAGGHFNPAGKQHGKDNPQGAHAGDLPNLEVPADGQVTVDATARGVSLDSGPNGLLDADGSALVIHEGADDYKSDPAGNAGKRIACGVVSR
jgi:Cu-Zn family superoxide dismutase